MEPINDNHAFFLEGLLVEPGKSIGKVQLGMDRVDVKKAYSDRILQDGKPDLVDCVEELGLRIYYNDEEKVSFLEASSQNILFMKDVEVFKSTIEEISNIFTALYPGAKVMDEDLALDIKSHGISFVKGDEGEPPKSVEVFLPEVAPI